YLFVASMDVDPDKEALFSEIYDAEHVPNLLKVPGVHAATRIKGEPFALKIGGGMKTIIHEGARYSTVYEIDGPARPCQSRMGKGGGGRSLAKASASVYSQTNARPVQGPLVSASSATAGGTSAPATGWCELGQRRAGKTRSRDIDCKPERLRKRAGRFCTTKPMVSGMNLREAIGPPTAWKEDEMRVEREWKEQVGRRKGRARVMSIGAD